MLNSAVVGALGRPATPHEALIDFGHASSSVTSFFRALPPSLVAFWNSEIVKIWEIEN